MKYKKKNKIEFLVVFTITTFLASMLSFISIFGESMIRDMETEPGVVDGFTKPMDGFTVTAYCPGSCCNGIWEGKTVHGANLDAYLSLGIPIIAVDPSVIPLGTLVQYGDRLYLSADTGGKIKGKRIDVLLSDHKSTVDFGVRRNQSVVLLGDTGKGD